MSAKEDYKEKSEGVKYLEKIISNNRFSEQVPNSNIFGGEDFSLQEAYYHEVYKLLDKRRYNLQDVKKFTEKQDNTYTGVFISAALNKIIKDSDTVHLDTIKPLDYLLYRFSKGKVEVDKAGHHFAAKMSGGSVYAKKAGNYAFSEMEGGYGSILVAGDWLGYGMRGGKIEVHKAGEYTFMYTEGGMGEVHQARKDHTKELFSAGKFFKVLGKPVTMNGQKRLFYFLDIKDSVMVAAVTNKNEVIMEKHFRPVLDKSIYELPAGYIDEDEKPIDSARRELEEETGYKAEKIKLLFSAYQNTARSKQKMYFFLADDLSKGKKKEEKGERIDEVVNVKLGDAVKMIKRGKILDANAIACIYYLLINRM